MRLLLTLLLATPLHAAEFPLRDARECVPRDGLPNIAHKLKTANEVKVAYLGGSITAAPGWRVQSREWLERTNAPGRVTGINAAIGGTGSDLGVFRLRQDVLKHGPDLLFVEFAVNDGGAPPEQIKRTMEGIVRQTWKANPATDICFVYTLAERDLANLTAGKLQRSASVMEAVADHYGIPSIQFGVPVSRLVRDGKLVFKGDPESTDTMVFSKDGVHPLVDTGHDLYQQSIARAWPALTTTAKPAPHALSAPLMSDNWEHAKLVPLTAAKLDGRWTLLDAAHPLKMRFGRRLPEIRMAESGGARIEFRFQGTVAGIYDLLGPDCGQIKVRVDDQPEQTIPRFDGYCTYHRLAKHLFATGLAPGAHRAVLTLDANPPDKAGIIFGRNRPDMQAHPAKYDGTRWYVGSLMLIGEVVDTP